MTQTHAPNPSLRARAATFGLSESEYDLLVSQLERHPNALEAAIVGAMWSEHCGYKNSRPLFKAFPTEGPQVLQGPGENAGVVDIGEGWGVAFKMESHNHPSAVEPVQGAATGVGGILRDIFAMGARPFAVLDSLRFGDPDAPRTRFLVNGVVEGISHYGNAIGVPTVGGEVTFHPSYQENPLVNVMALGLLRHEDLAKGTMGEVGNQIIYVGSKTGRDGLGGAVFASADLSDASQADRPAVQVGDPFMEKLLLEATLEAIESGVVAGVQDMGAAGLVSPAPARWPTAPGWASPWTWMTYPPAKAGMVPMELCLSESQERMILVPVPGREQELLRPAGQVGTGRGEHRTGRGAPQLPPDVEGRGGLRPAGGPAQRGSQVHPRGRGIPRDQGRPRARPERDAGAGRPRRRAAGNCSRTRPSPANAPFLSATTIR